MRFALVLLALVACDEPEPEPEPTTGGYAVHEWGFLAHHFADGPDSHRWVGATPGRFARPSGESIGLGSIGTIGHGGKPILYVHLDEGVDALDLSATLTLATQGRFPEHLPAGDLNDNVLRWRVSARPGSCSARERYPSPSDPRCREPGDGYCEAAELYAYETSDAACLRVGDADWNHLFYRATAPGAMPIRVEPSQEGLMIHNDAADAIPSKLIRIRRHEDAADTRVHVFDAPAAGQSALLPDQTESPARDASQALRSALSALGMTGAETNAFMVAWEAELLGDAADASERPPIQVGSPPRELEPKADSLVYFMPRASVDALIGLQLDPAPHTIQRAILVRVDLNPHPGGTIGLGNLGRITDGYGRAPGMRSPFARIQWGTLNVAGSLNREVVRRYLRRHVPELRTCYEDAGSGTEGGLTLRLILGTDGDVASATVGDNQLSEELGACVVRAARTWQFAAPEGGVVRVSQRLVFSPPASSDSDEDPAPQ